jgi:hypothetical protein
MDFHLVKESSGYLNDAHVNFQQFIATLLILDIQINHVKA